MKYTRAWLLIPLLGLSACAVVPTGPSVMALPGSNRVFDDFLRDDAACRQFASQRIGSEPAVQQAQTDATVKNTAIATVIGAVAGAAFGGRDGAAAGAGVGLLAGSLAGTGNTSQSNYAAQSQYDQAYVQCMYGHGHKVPVQGRLMESAPTASSPAPIPPPPAGMPPPPPPSR